LKTKLPKGWKGMTMTGIGVERKVFSVK